VFGIFATLRRIERKLDLLLHLTGGVRMTAQDILDKVTAETTLDQSIAALVTELRTELAAAIASGDPAKLQQISDLLDSNDAILNAVRASTPSA